MRKTCIECFGEGFVKANPDKPIHWNWRSGEGYNPSNTKTCPRCGGSGYEPEEEPDEGKPEQR